MPTYSKTLPSLLLICLFTSACWSTDTSAQFTLSGKSTSDPKCFEHAFPLDAKLTAARHGANSVSLVFQSETTDFNLNNSVYIEVYQPDTVRQSLTQPIPISPPTALDAIVGAKITLFASCPDSVTSFYLDGDIIFTALENGKSAHMAGSITDARILNTRTNEVVADGLSGSWDFNTRPGQPFQPFYALP